MDVYQPKLSKKERIRRWLGAVWTDGKSLLSELPRAILFAGIITVGVFVASRQATFIEQPWPYFQMLQRATLWLIRGAAFRSLVAPVVLLLIYGALYFAFGIRGRRFILVSEFRVWGGLEKTAPPKGVEGLLQDELIRLLAEMRAREPGVPTERIRADSSSNEPNIDTPTYKPELGGGFVPDTQVTVQYEGVSLEGLHTFFRRYSQREVVITGELMKHPDGFLIVARAKDYGPWEVLMPTLDTASLRMGMEKLAIRILISLAQGFLPREANNFVFLQFKALALREYDLAVRLGQLALSYAPRRYKDQGRNILAAAYVSKGRSLTDKKQHKEAIGEYKKATELSPVAWHAWYNLGLAYKEIGMTKESEDALGKAARLRKT